MPVHRSYQPSDIEKRLKLLTQQLYGKNNKQSLAISLPAGKAGLQLSDKQSDDRRLTTENYSVSDLTFLKQDLTKIVILASLAIGAQLILYFSQLPSKIKLF